MTLDQDTSDLIDQLRELESSLSARAAQASTAAQVRELDAELNASLAQVSRGIGGLPSDQRRQVGQILGEVRARLSELVALRRKALARRDRAEQLESERLDLSEVLPGRLQGHLHLVAETQASLEDTFVGMGFKVAE